MTAYYGPLDGGSVPEPDTLEPGHWERTPRWAFWRPKWRRLAWEDAAHSEYAPFHRRGWQYASDVEMVRITLLEG